MTSFAVESRRNDDADASALKQRSVALPGWDLDARQLRDLELLLNGAFSPLAGYLVRRDYERVVSEARLADGTPSSPLTLDVSEAFAATIAIGSEIALRDSQGVTRAMLDVEDIYWTDHLHEARAVFSTTDRTHPGVAALLDHARPVYLGGRVRGIRTPTHDALAGRRGAPRD
ncbi:hypothetical protein [Dokdonella soli]|uniref:hypothetical protein n=1 Tax=Dokdonella soli TaxID=529810 RepID=UPI0031E045D7